MPIETVVSTSETNDCQSPKNDLKCNVYDVAKKFDVVKITAVKM